MGKVTLRAWILLILLPLIPVIVLYIFFAGQNYFELKDAAKGIVAVGPIAAYVAIVLLGWKAMIELSKEGRSSNPQLNELTGEWILNSKSIHDTLGGGDCFIENNQGALTITGNLSENGRNLGTWQSEMTLVKDHNLYIFYSMTQVKGTGSLKLDAMCTLIFGPAPVKQMTGTWIVIGMSDRAGQMTLTRK